jgi:hypothetical protein
MKAASAQQNVYIGGQAGYNSTSGEGNFGLGYQSLYSNTSGNYNSALGMYALYSNATGVNNICIGSYAGYNEMGSNKLYIETSTSSTPLIGGLFDSDRVGINTPIASIAKTLHVTGTARITSLDTDVTAPTTSGTTKMVISDANGDLSFEAIPAGTVTGTGTNTQLTKWTGTGSIGGIANGTGLLYNNGSGAYTWVSGSLPGLTSGKLWIGNYLGVASERTISGDATISDMGVLSLADPVLAKGKKGTTAQTISSTSITKVDISEDFSSGITVSNANETFTVNTGNAGYYEVTYNYFLRTTSAARDIYSYIYKNGSQITDEILTTTLSLYSYIPIAYSTILYLNASDYIDLRVESTSSSSFNIHHANITIKKIK